MPADIGAGYFRLVARPDDDEVADFVGGIISKPIETTDTPASSINACVELIAVKRFGRAFAPALDDVNRSAHLPASREEYRSGHDFVCIEIKPENDESTAGRKLEKSLVGLAPTLDTTETVATTDQDSNNDHPERSNDDIEGDAKKLEARRECD